MIDMWRVALPAPTSRLYPVARTTVARLLREADLDLDGKNDRELVLRPGGDVVEILFCRGTDIPTLVTRGVVDAGFTGYDVAVEGMLATGTPLDVRSLAPARTSYLCLAAGAERTDTRIIYTEYPFLARSWAATTRMYRHVEVVALHGALEGIVAVDHGSAALVLVTSGSTLRANGLRTLAPVIATDLCVVRPDRGSTEFGELRLDSLPRLTMPDFCTRRE